MFVLFLPVTVMEEKVPQCIVVENCGELFNVGNPSEIVMKWL